ncbi:MAG TPA: non-canonical purine NTP pyrophosphatase [Lacipirellulaceae bacterium]|nr:non-canonical purine NTP pyrophosphatase [Lacipirellulaceae bacterium]
MGDLLFPLLIGTTNAAKGRELVGLLGPLGFAVKTLRDMPPAPDVVEDGDTFAANARKKAAAYARHFDAWVLADDSGLEVDALNGRPGVFSARYAGPNASDADNNARLLAELADRPEAQRGAGYYCHVALADPSGEIRAESTGTCRGRISMAEVGTNGFGYDPLFFVREFHQTFGQLGPSVKAAISHRARAMRAIVPHICNLAAAGHWHSQRHSEASSDRAHASLTAEYQQKEPLPGDKPAAAPMK